MQTFVITTNFDRALTVNAESRAEAMRKLARGLAIGEIMLTVEMI